MPGTVKEKIILLRHHCTDPYTKGKCYEEGRFVGKDRDIALHYYRQAVEKGLYQAYARIGALLEQKNEIAEAIQAYYQGAAHHVEEARHHLEMLAEARQPQACYYSGLIEEHHQNWDRAHHWYNIAARLGHGESFYRIGLLHQEDRILPSSGTIYLHKNSTGELLWYQKAALLGVTEAVTALQNLAPTQADAALYLANIYREGEGGLKRDVMLAVAYYRLASQLGSSEADFKLGLLFELGGEVGEANYLMAVTYYLKAAQQQHRAALEKLLFLADKNPPDKEFFFTLGRLYHTVLNQMPDALHWYKRAADLHHSESLEELQNISQQTGKYALLLGEAYEKESQTVWDEAAINAFHFYLLAVANKAEPDNACKALKCAEKIAEYADAAALCHLGKILYALPNGLEAAATWWLKAAKDGSREAITALDTATFTADIYCTIARAYAEAGRQIKRAVLFYEKAACAGEMEACLTLGNMYENGYEDQSADLLKAAEYYAMAAHHYPQEAVAKLEALYAQSHENEIAYKIGAIHEQIFQDMQQTICWYRQAADTHHEEAALRLKLRASHHPEFAYHTAQSYEADSSAKSAFSEIAVTFYLLALQNEYMPAETRLEAMAQQGNNKAAFGLGTHYYFAQRQEEKAVYWCMKAAESGHKEAWDFLHHTPFSASTLFTIAHIFDEGLDAITPNKAHACLFYEKAGEAGEREAYFRLGQLYEQGIDPYASDRLRASEYYLKALKAGHTVALLILQSIADDLHHKDIDYALATFYHHDLKEPGKALIWYKKAYDHAHADGFAALERIASLAGSYAYRIAQLFEESTPVSSAQSWYFYALAMRQGEEEAAKALKRAAYKGESEAQYALATVFYHHQQQDIEASYWCMQAAEKGHVGAYEFLHHTGFSAEIFLSIARKYDQGTEEIPENRKLACQFYVKASQRGNSEADFRLGQLYEEGDEGGLQDIEKACEHYIKAARACHDNALKNLIELAEEQQNKDLAYALGELYQQQLNNIPAAIRWFHQAAVQGHSTALKQVVELAKQHADYAYQLGTLLAQSAPSFAYKYLAYHFYAFAAGKGHEAAREALQNCAAAGITEAQYVLGIEIYYPQGQTEKAIYWCRLAAEQGHQKALNFLMQTSFDADLCMELAKEYEKGWGVRQNIPRANYFYEQAFAKGKEEARLQIAYMREAEQHKKAVVRNQAASLYDATFRKKDKKAGAALRRLMDEKNKGVCSSPTETVHVAQVTRVMAPKKQQPLRTNSPDALLPKAERLAFGSATPRARNHTTPFMSAPGEVHKATTSMSDTSNTPVPFASAQPQTVYDRGALTQKSKPSTSAYEESREFYNPYAFADSSTPTSSAPSSKAQPYSTYSRGSATQKNTLAASSTPSGAGKVFSNRRAATSSTTTPPAPLSKAQPSGVSSGRSATQKHAPAASSTASGAGKSFYGARSSSTSSTSTPASTPSAAQFSGVSSGGSATQRHVSAAPSAASGRGRIFYHRREAASSITISPATTSPPSRG